MDYKTKEDHDMKLKVRCENCNFWSPLNDGEYGECCFNPPVFLSHREAKFDNHGYFPITKINCWCGKFKKEDG